MKISYVLEVRYRLFALRRAVPLSWRSPRSWALHFFVWHRTAEIVFIARMVAMAAAFALALHGFGWVDDWLGSSLGGAMAAVFFGQIYSAVRIARDERGRLTERRITKLAAQHRVATLRPLQDVVEALDDDTRNSAIVELTDRALRSHMPAFLRASQVDEWATRYESLPPIDGADAARAILADGRVSIVALPKVGNDDTHSIFAQRAGAALEHLEHVARGDFSAARLLALIDWSLLLIREGTRGGTRAAMRAAEAEWRAVRATLRAPVVASTTMALGGRDTSASAGAIARDISAVDD